MEDLYAERTQGVKGNCTHGVLYSGNQPVHNAYMAGKKEKKVTPRPKRPVYKPPFVKQWREYRNMTQEKLADLVGEYLGKSYTYASVGRIENGKMPYTQPVLEAMADALGTDCASLLIRDPTKPEAIWTLWERALPAERETIEEHAEFVVSKRKSG